ncbi:hypothetical protein ACLM5H_05035 [Fredinandcohnia humi]
MIQYMEKFQLNSDYKKAFEEAVTELIEINMPVQWKNKAVQDLTDAYIEQTGEIPDSLQLQRLANYILHEELKDKHPDKVANTEYPILSDRQVIIRSKREIVRDDFSYFSHDKKHKLNGRKNGSYLDRESV